MVYFGGLRGLMQGLLLLSSISRVTFAATTSTTSSTPQPSERPTPPPPVPEREFKSVIVTVEGDPRNRRLPTEKRIVYYVDRGFAITDGDVNIGYEADLLARAQASNGNSDEQPSKRQHLERVRSKRSHSIFPEWDYAKWPDATYTWKFFDMDAQTELQYKMTEAIRLWKEAAPYFRFVQLPTSSEYAPGIVTVMVTRGQPACWAPIGWCEGCGLYISLDTACNVANTVHEIGHSLGLHHEHQRPDRDDYMFFNCSALADYDTYGTDASTCPGNPQQCCASETCFGWACSFAKLLGYDSHGPLDAMSVMHYREDAFSSWRDWPFHETLIGINGHVVPPYDYEKPSEGDATRLCEIYYEECERGPVEDPVCGNGIVEVGEECDDGNLNDGDGCNAYCRVEIPPMVCQTCDPNPLLNRCDITTSCISARLQGETFCACRAGYKADPGSVGEGDGPVEWRMNFVGQEYRVFVKPGVACNTLCDGWDQGTENMCREVPIEKSCSS